LKIKFDSPGAYPTIVEFSSTTLALL
jgi:hypothetical protein